MREEFNFKFFGENAKAKLCQRCFLGHVTGGPDHTHLCSQTRVVYVQVSDDTIGLHASKGASPGGDDKVL